MTYTCCTWKLDKLQCRYPAAFANATNGGDVAKWFCRGHDDEIPSSKALSIAKTSQGYSQPDKASVEARIQAEAYAFTASIGASTVAEMQEWRKNQRGFAPPSRDWIKRLEARRASGEILNTIQEQFLEKFNSALQGENDD